MSAPEERVLTSGEVATYCKVHLRTVIRWIEKGRLKAYKLPGRGNNRIEQKEFLRFLIQYNMPIPTDLQNHFVEQNQVLIVDDDVNMAKSLQRALTLAGYQTYVAHDGFQAGVQLAQVRPQLLTLDLNMPKMDGFAMLEFLRQQPMFASLKILVISALDDRALTQAWACGADHVLAKPFQGDELLMVVAGLLAA